MPRKSQIKQEPTEFRCPRCGKWPVKIFPGDTQEQIENAGYEAVGTTYLCPWCRQVEEAK